jgi:hypothetical protein
MDRDRASEDPGPDHDHLTITVAIHRRSFVPAGRERAPAEASLPGRRRSRMRRPDPDEAAVRSYREPEAAVMLEVTGRRPGIAGARRFRWDAAYEMS